MTCRVSRSNSCTPSRSSSRRTCWLMAPAVTCSSCAACLKLRWRAAASKARSALSGGSRYVMAGSERCVGPQGERVLLVPQQRNPALSLVTARRIHGRPARQRQRKPAVVPPETPSIETSYSWIRLVVTIALSTLGCVGMWSVVVALPAVQADFNVARADATLPYTLTTIGFMFGGIMVGRL